MRGGKMREKEREGRGGERKGEASMVEDGRWMGEKKWGEKEGDLLQDLIPQEMPNSQSMCLCITGCLGCGYMK